MISVRLIRESDEPVVHIKNCDGGSLQVVAARTMGEIANYISLVFPINTDFVGVPLNFTGPRQTQYPKVLFFSINEQGLSEQELNLLSSAMKVNTSLDPNLKVNFMKTFAVNLGGWKNVLSPQDQLIFYRIFGF